MRICAASLLEKSFSTDASQSSPCPRGVGVTIGRWDNFVAAELTSSLNWRRTSLAVNRATITAKAARMTNVSAADPPASRHRTGTVLYAEYVARAADRM